ncbi:MAG TPA: hypothetical protein VK466_04345, partial [Terriglobales bacterium]|nr:hypothetical protein [Terriglobales bacterium]
MMLLIYDEILTPTHFQEVLADRKVVFLKLSAALSPDIKKFIGTIVISELLHAVRNRPEDQHGQFCVYIDEFQNFANSEDLA